MSFSKNPRYLFNYYLFLTFFWGVANLVYLLFFHIESQAPLLINAYDVLILCSAIYIGALSVVFIHNAAHGNFSKQKWLNFLIGEISDSFQYNGFLGWRAAHQFHHRYADDPILDPHHPGKKTFFKFALTMVPMINSRLTFFYFRMFPQTPENLRYWSGMSRFRLSAGLLRILFFFFLMGPKYFLMFMIPAIATATLMQAHFNYYTHRPTADGKTEILNLNHNWSYQFLNKILFGIYFHKNHHLNERLFDPSLKI